MARTKKDAEPILLDYIERGYTYTASCRAAGITLDCMVKWRKKYPEFDLMVKEAESRRREKIQNEIEASLFDKAKGMKITESKTEYIAGPEGSPIIAKQIKTEKTIPPDTAAIIFALTNLAPEKWKNYQKTEQTDTTSENKDADLSKLSDSELAEYQRLMEKIETDAKD